VFTKDIVISMNLKVFLCCRVFTSVFHTSYFNFLVAGAVCVRLDM
jgi:hypothetical protein